MFVKRDENVKKNLHLSPKHIHTVNEPYDM